MTMTLGSFLTTADLSDADLLACHDRLMEAEEFYIREEAKAHRVTAERDKVAKVLEERGIDYDADAAIENWQRAEHVRPLDV
jgi:hypothetical protein